MFVCVLVCQEKCVFEGKCVGVCVCVCHLSMMCGAHWVWFATLHYNIAHSYNLTFGTSPLKLPKRHNSVFPS